MSRGFKIHNASLELVLGAVPAALLYFIYGDNRSDFLQKLNGFILTYPLQLWIVYLFIFGFIIPLLNIKIRFTKKLILFCLDLISAFVGIVQSLNGIVMFIIAVAVWRRALNIRLFLLVVFYLCAHASAVYLSKFVDSEKRLSEKMT